MPAPVRITKRRQANVRSTDNRSAGVAPTFNLLGSRTAVDGHSWDDHYKRAAEKLAADSSSTAQIAQAVVASLMTNPKNRQQLAAAGLTAEQYIQRLVQSPKVLADLVEEQGGTASNVIAEGLRGRPIPLGSTINQGMVSDAAWTAEAGITPAAIASKLPGLASFAAMAPMANDLYHLATAPVGRPEVSRYGQLYAQAKQLQTLRAQQARAVGPYREYLNTQVNQLAPQVQQLQQEAERTTPTTGEQLQEAGANALSTTSGMVFSPSLKALQGASEMWTARKDPDAFTRATADTAGRIGGAAYTYNGPNGVGQVLNPQIAPVRAPLFNEAGQVSAGTTRGAVEAAAAKEAERSTIARAAGRAWSMAKNPAEAAAAARGGASAAWNLATSPAARAAAAATIARGATGVGSSLLSGLTRLPGAIGRGLMRAPVASVFANALAAPYYIWKGTTDKGSDELGADAVDMDQTLRHNAESNMFGSAGAQLAQNARGLGNLLMFNSQPLRAQFARNVMRQQDMTQDFDIRDKEVADQQKLQDYIANAQEGIANLMPGLAPEQQKMLAENAGMRRWRVEVRHDMANTQSDIQELPKLFESLVEHKILSKMPTPKQAARFAKVEQMTGWAPAVHALFLDDKGEPDYAKITGTMNTLERASTPLNHWTTGYLGEPAHTAGAVSTWDPNDPKQYAKGHVDPAPASTAPTADELAFREAVANQQTAREKGINDRWANVRAQSKALYARMKAERGFDVAQAAPVAPRTMTWEIPANHGRTDVAQPFTYVPQITPKPDPQWVPPAYQVEQDHQAAIAAGKPWTPPYKNMAAWMQGGPPMASSDVPVTADQWRANHQARPSAVPPTPIKPMAPAVQPTMPSTAPPAPAVQPTAIAQNGTTPVPTP